jgi:hypothetical protein
MSTEVDEHIFYKYMFIDFRAQKGGETWYAVNKKLGYLHRLILDLKPDDLRQSDHIDRDGLNNKLSNLRIATQSQNNMNRQFNRRFKGVDWHESAQKFRSRIKKDGQIYYLGFFDTEEEAALAYNVAAERMFGTFARLNTL